MKYVGCASDEYIAEFRGLRGKFSGTSGSALV